MRPADTIAAAPAPATRRGQRLFLRRNTVARRIDRVSTNRLGDILDAMAAQRAVIEVQLVSDVLVDGM